jgi:hypothetical protein
MIAKAKIPTLTFAVLLLLTMSFSTVRSQTDSIWKVQTVDSNGAGMGNNGYCPIAGDSNNIPHVAYTRSSYDSNSRSYSFSVMYASWNGSKWNSQRVAEGGALSLALDAGGNPHILYSDFMKPLMYAYWTGYGWAISTVDRNGAGYGVLAFDSSGNLHAAYTDGTTVKYATLSGSSWAIQTIDTYVAGGVSYQLSLALDKNNTAYILYDFTVSIPDSSSSNTAYWDLKGLKMAICRNVRLIGPIHVIQNITYASGFSNLVLDSNGNPGFVYQTPEFGAAANSTLVYASLDGSVWVNRTVIASNIGIASGNLHGAISLNLDSQGYPHISFQSSSLGLMYASWSGIAWNIQAVGDGGIWPGYLAVDSNGNPHISYRSSSWDKIVPIKYATANAIELNKIPSISASPTPSPSVPELSWLIILPLLLSLFSIAVLVRRRKQVKKV